MSLSDEAVEAFAHNQYEAAQVLATLAVAEQLERLNDAMADKTEMTLAGSALRMRCLP